jgi:hypothetical protein
VNEYTGEPASMSTEPAARQVATPATVTKLKRYSCAVAGAWSDATHSRVAFSNMNVSGERPANAPSAVGSAVNTGGVRNDTAVTLGRITV